MRTFLAILIVLSFSCYAEKPDLYKVSGANTYFTNNYSSFDDYLQKTQQMLKKNANRLLAERNAPYQLPTDTENQRFKNGVLLIHGLLGTPFEMRDIGEYFQSKGFLVRSILLPGHGTVPGDLLKVDHSDWVKAVDYGINSLAKEVDNVYAVGFSTGGGLALNAAYKHKDLKGLVLFAPAIKINSPIDFAASYVKPFKKWRSKKLEDNQYKYESMTYNSIAQVYSVTKNIKKSSKQALEIPMMFILSEDDGTLSAEESIAFLNKQKNANNKLILYTQADAQKLAPPHDNVVSFSHLAMHIAPENFHYGANGNYKTCGHYQRETPQWKACKAGEGVLGESSKDLIKKHTQLRRLTYNPLYYQMITQIDEFLAAVD